MLEMLVRLLGKLLSANSKGNLLDVQLVQRKMDCMMGIPRGIEKVQMLVKP
jgi:hypothetical protein